MTTDTASVEETKAAVVAAEQQLRAAIEADDYPVVESLLADEVHYNHSNGLIEDKAEFMKSLTRRHRVMSREDDLEARVYDGFVLLLGGYRVASESRDQSSPTRHIDATGLQVWINRDGRWQLLVHQGTVKLKKE